MNNFYEKALATSENNFGEVLRMTGSMAKTNPFRFSTKYQDDETDMLYYGYRYYNASTGRWLSRDPVGEEGGVNLYCLIGNSTTDRIDPLGLKIYVIKRPLTFTTEPWTKLLFPVAQGVGGLGGLPGKAAGLYAAAIAEWYKKNTWHCVLIIAPNCEASGKNGKFTHFEGVDPENTWDFHENSQVHNVAGDWEGGRFKSEYYQGRRSIQLVVQDDSKDASLKEVMEASRKQPHKYIVGGSKRYNCCDWVTEVLGNIGVQFDAANPKPFGNADVPSWIPADKIGEIIDSRQK